MGIANKFNKGGVFNFKMPEKIEYISLRDLFNNNGEKHIYTIHAIYINRKSKYGDSPVVAIGGNQLVNFPKHMMDSINAIMLDGEAIEAINNGKLGFVLHTYTTKQRPDELCIGVNYVDIE